MAMNCCEVPFGIDGFEGVTAIDTRTAGPTVIVVLPVTEPDAALTCEVPGGSFVLDKTDFKALTGPNATSDESRKGEPVLTPEYVATLKRTSVLRHQICDSRALLRQVKSGRCEQEDFDKNFRLWLPQNFTDEEQKVLIKCQIDLATR